MIVRIPIPDDPSRSWFTALAVEWFDGEPGAINPLYDIDLVRQEVVLEVFVPLLWEANVVAEMAETEPTREA